MYLPFDPPYPKSIIAYDSTIAPQCLSHPDLAREDVPEEAEGIVQRFVVNVTVQISDLIWLSLCQTQKKSLSEAHCDTLFRSSPTNSVRLPRSIPCTKSFSHEKMSLSMGQLRLSIEVNKT